MNKVLIVDDDESVRLGLRGVLEASGFSVRDAASGRKAMELCRREIPDAVLLDLRMPDIDGAGTMLELKKIDPDIPIIILTAHGDIPTAVELIKQGAYDFLAKPPKVDNLVLILKRAVEKLKLERGAKDSSSGSSLEWLGKSKAMKNVSQQVGQVARSDFSVIIQGETGTGKSVIARAIHDLSKRSEAPFVTVDIGAIPDTLIESELFGHEKGAFTGAERKTKGYFETAHGGTIFMDELENMSPFIQAKLLKVVEEKQFYSLGSTMLLGVDFRILAATNTDIAQNVLEKKFREDLFYRLGEFIITLPPLRERIEDIPFLAQKFLLESAGSLDKPAREISDNALNLLVRYPWPGNVRELRSLMKRAVLLSNDSTTIRPEHVSFLIDDMHTLRGSSTLFPLKSALKDTEKRVIRKALDMTAGNKSKAASLLEVDYKTLLSKMKEYGI